MEVLIKVRRPVESVSLLEFPKVGLLGTAGLSPWFHLPGPRFWVPNFDPQPFDKRRPLELPRTPRVLIFLAK